MLPSHQGLPKNCRESSPEYADLSSAKLSNWRISLLLINFYPRNKKVYKNFKWNSHGLSKWLSWIFWWNRSSSQFCMCNMLQLFFFPAGISPCRALSQVPWAPVKSPTSTTSGLLSTGSQAFKINWHSKWSNAPCMTCMTNLKPNENCDGHPICINLAPKHFKKNTTIRKCSL